MNFTIRDYFNIAGIGAAFGTALSLLSIIGKTILLIRMNAQQCIPETSMWEYFDIDFQLIRLAAFIIIAIVVAIVMELAALIPPLKINFNLPTILIKIANILKWAGIVFVVTTVIILIALMIYTLFIKTPC